MHLVQSEFGTMRVLLMSRIMTPTVHMDVPFNSAVAIFPYGLRGS
jgi:hypothetical protein